MEDIKAIKSEEFAIMIVNMVKELKDNKQEYIMSKQILRSGTSIGANIAEANGAESDADFIHKLTISQKEAYETSYWLRLLYKTNYINDECFMVMNAKCNELISIIVAILKKMRK
jgi:four helix bundle protein